jgi:hypothetical protein
MAEDEVTREPLSPGEGPFEIHGVVGVQAPESRTAESLSREVRGKAPPLPNCRQATPETQTLSPFANGPNLAGGATVRGPAGAARADTS